MYIKAAFHQKTFGIRYNHSGKKNRYTETKMYGFDRAKFHAREFVLSSDMFGILSVRFSEVGLYSDLSNVLVSVMLR